MGPFLIVFPNTMPLNYSHALDAHEHRASASADGALFEWVTHLCDCWDGCTVRLQVMHMEILS